MITAHVGFPMPTEAQVAAAAPGTLFMPLLDFSPAKGESWRGPRLMYATVYVNAEDGWEHQGFYALERLTPRQWQVRVTESHAVDSVPVGTYKTREAALDAAGAHLRARATAVSA